MYNLKIQKRVSAENNNTAFLVLDTYDDIIECINEEQYKILGDIIDFDKDSIKIAIINDAFKSDASGQFTGKRFWHDIGCYKVEKKSEEEIIFLSMIKKDCYIACDSPLVVFHYEKSSCVLYIYTTCDMVQFGTEFFNTLSILSSSSRVKADVDLRKVYLESEDSFVKFGIQASMAIYVRNIDISSWDLTPCRLFDGSFCRMQNLESVKFNNNFVLHPSSLAYMFKGCSSLGTLDLSMFSFDNFPSCRSMFEGAYADEIVFRDEIVDIESMNTDIMFAYSRIKKLDLSSFRNSDKEPIKGRNIFLNATIDVLDIRNINISSMEFGTLKDIRECYINKASFKELKKKGIKYDALFHICDGNKILETRKLF